MNWEEIEDSVKSVIVQFFWCLSKTEKMHRQVSEKQKEEDCLVEELLNTDLLDAERIQRSKYDYRFAWQRFRRERRKRLIRRWISVAACFALFVSGFGWYFGVEEGEEEGKVGLMQEEKQVVLVLGSGKSVILDRKDSLRLEEGNKVIQAYSGKITYRTEKDREEKSENRFNTLSVPRGMEYRIELADGTKVHLNAESELKYPVAFAAGRREVKLQGEAWFEVAKDEACPFYVLTDDIQIRVYGTAFNINTHGIRTVQTVLVEGNIGIKGKEAGEELKIFPGQLAEYDREQCRIQIKEVDTRQYTAWREGIFYFDDETLEDILNELARWYDMELFFYSRKIKELHFTGHLSRYEDIRKILSTITESTGVVFDIDKKTIIVR